MSPSRRTLLRTALATVVASVAGCARDDERVGAETREAGGRSGTDRDPIVERVRNPGGEAVLEETDADGGSLRRELITDDERLDDIAVAPGVPDARADAARTFLAETDFDAESVYVAHANVESCERYRIDSVSWEPGRVEYEYCRELRPPDHECRADQWETVALLFRLPVVLERDLTESGSSGRSPCRTVETDYERVDANATVPGSNGALDPGDRP